MKPKPKKTELLAEEVRQLAYNATNPVEREILIEAAVRLKDLLLIAEFYHHELELTKNRQEFKKQ